MDAEVATATAPHPFDLPLLCRQFSALSPQPMVAVEGPTHLVRYVNPAFVRLAGGTARQLLGLPFAEAVPEQAGNGCAALLDRVFQTGVPESLAEQAHRGLALSFWSYTMWAILGADDRPAGVAIQITDSTEAAVFRLQSTAMNEALVVSSVRQHELLETIQKSEADRRRLESQLFQAQKLESLGILAGGIAHDLNNILTPVLGYTELAADALPADSPAAEMLEEVRKNATRAADLVQQILTFAGKGVVATRPVDLSELVRDMKGLLAAVVPAQTELRYSLEPSLDAVDGDDTQLRQVVMNLVANAAEAVGARGGKVVVRTGMCQRSHPALPSAIPQADPPGERFVFLEVADSGCGMTADQIERIFDPFYTTKFTGRGLGLAVVQGIVRGHKGLLEVTSESGRGSLFRLLLPAVAPAHSPAPARETPPGADGWAWKGTVLVAEDEDALRTLVRRTLEPAGIEVLTARDGVECLDVYRARPQSIDLVLLDLTMPRMGGLEAKAALRQLRPDLPIVLMSGYCVQDVQIMPADSNTTTFLQKPFRSPELLAAMRLVLNQ